MTISEKHIGLDTMYDNTHGNETLSILDAISGILENAQSMGAEESDCEDVRAEIITGIQFKTHKEIKQHLVDGCYLVRIDGGFMDVGYLLSERF